MKTGQIFIRIIAVIALMTEIILAMFSGVGKAYAATTGYSNVLDDLKQDASFNTADYPSVEDDYSINVIQIAESTDGEIFIYVYQPAAKVKLLKATSVNLALNESVEGTKLYSVTLINNLGVFQKYKINGLSVSSAKIRYYNITSIYRQFDKTIDEESAEGQTVTEVACKVAQLWTVTEENETVDYYMLTSEVIEITQKYVGYCVYDDGLTLSWGTMEGITKAYFVAFDTDIPIDKLLSADLTFYATRIKCKICVNSAHGHDLLYDFHDAEYIDYGTGVYNDTPLTIDYTQKFSNEGGGNALGRPANRYTFNRIRSTQDFIADNNNADYQMTSGNASKLADTKWVLNFYEAQDKCKINNVWLSFIPGISSISGVADGECELNNVFDVSILRLEFETDGESYNLGVVDNKQTGTDDPINEIISKTILQRIGELLGISEWALIVIVVVIILILLLSILSFVFPIVGQILLWLLKGIGFVIKYLFIGIWYIITAPFRLIAWLFGRKGNDGGGSKTND